ncbi:MAG: tetratricopeptide repeat protein [Gammaproteobacteria bacterium]|nr:tetratricopeptide repeat protein [Gammaproteobacteria bacterium]MBQ0840485.1 tetratricopeptide repeat protein [Gammaproteobacteria bacterium]
MADHLSDEQQLESLQRWWRENGMQLVLVIALTLAGWYGWQQWQGNKQARAEMGSLIYIEMMDIASQAPLSALLDVQREAMVEKSQVLKKDYANTQYANYAGLLLAKLAVAEKRLDDAAQELQTVIDNTQGEELSYIARMRLARLEMGRKNYPQALQVLEGDTPPAILASVAELRGDINLFAGDQLAARAAYQSALDAVGSNDQRLRALLELKLNQVLPSPAATSAASAGDES